MCVCAKNSKNTYFTGRIGMCGLELTRHLFLLANDQCGLHSVGVIMGRTREWQRSGRDQTPSATTWQDFQRFYSSNYAH